MWPPIPSLKSSRHRALMSAWNTGVSFDAWHSELRLLRHASIAREAVWQGVVARADQLLTDGASLVIVIRAARSTIPAPSPHDLLHARICTVIFQKTVNRSFESLRTLLHAPGEPHWEVSNPSFRLESHIELFCRPGKEPRWRRLPAPILAFLLHNQCRIGDFRLGQTPSGAID